MSDAPNPWAELLRYITNRPDWSIARLARKSGIHRSTIFRWINGDRRNLTVDSIKLIAEAGQIDLMEALRAAAALVAPDEASVERDDAERMILESDATAEQKQMMLARYRRRAEAARQQALDDVREQIELLGRSDHG